MSASFVVVDAITKVFTQPVGLGARLCGQRARRFCAVDAVSFRIGRGQTFALVGESGSGKSTIARMVVGLLAPSSGAVHIDGIALSGAPEPALRARVQMVFQDPYSSLNPRWRAGAIIGEPITALAPTSRIALRERVGELLTLVGLHPADARKYPHEFSGGQRQRIAIARALATNAEFIVFDEPTSALDVSVQAQILNLVRDLQDQLGLTYLFISHNLAVVRYVADHIGVLHQGRLVEAGPADRVFAAPEDPYTRALFAAVPTIDPEWALMAAI
jgi:peptide/nickel transport system ATP-binding protein